MTLKQVRLTVFIFLLCLFSGFFGYFIGTRNVFFKIQNSTPLLTIERKVPESKKEVNFALFWQVWDKLQEYYFLRKDLDPGKMVYGAISGLVDSLGDPYTVFLPPEDNKQSKDDLTGSFEGVGIQLGYKDDRLAVIAPLKGTPADKAGVKAGDIILKIVDQKRKIDKETGGISLPEAVSLIKGPKGSSVKLTLGREGLSDSFEVELKRDTIVVKSVELEFKEANGKKVAILKLTRFGERTASEWEEAVLAIKEEELKSRNSFGGVILDVRNNPGGFLNGAVFIASEFMAEGTVVEQDSGENGKEVYPVNRKGSLLKEPLVVLVNQGSASASEIVAGALQEAKRGKIVGEKTFGKGTIQKAEDLPGGAGLHVTIARWLLPSGRSIDKEGIKPDFEVKMDEKDETKDPQLDKATELLTK